MKKGAAGTLSGIIATISFSEINLWIGFIASLFTAICLFPGMVLSWRKLIFEYRKFSLETQKSGFVYFLLFCSGVLRPIPQTQDPFQK